MRDFAPIWLKFGLKLSSDHGAAQREALGLGEAAGGDGPPGGIDVDPTPDGGETVSQAQALLGGSHMGEQHERQIRPVMLHDEKEVFQLFVIEGADDFQIAEQGIELMQIAGVAAVEACGDAP
jgi:hypothetical protein